jgi:hypothetical protein
MLARIELFLPRAAPRQQLLPALIEAALQLRYESERFRSEDLRELGGDVARDGDTLGEWAGHVHSSILCTAIWHRNMKSWADKSRLNSFLDVAFHIVR